MNTAAFFIGTHQSQVSPLSDLARGVGFNVVKPFGGLSEVERQMAKTPTCFFLFEQVHDVKHHAEAVETIRSCKRRNLRFMPLIYFCEKPSHDTIGDCIGIGFDDVITTPFSYDRIKQRLNLQLNQLMTYYETATYFGPDRRQTLVRKPAPQSENRNGGDHRKYDFERSIVGGTRLLNNRLDAA